MTTTDVLQAVAAIAAGPAGPQVGAFFDLDGTLIAGYSARFLAQDRLRRRDINPTEIFKSITLLAGSRGVDVDTFGQLMAISAAGWKGRQEADLDAMGERMFAKDVEGLIYPEMREIVAAHRRAGHTIVLSSSASSFQVEPVAQHLGIDHVLCNRFHVDDGRLTGEIVAPVVWGPGKAAAAEAFADENGLDLMQSYFYADGDEDVALMRIIGHPRPTNPGRGLSRAADEGEWPVLRLTSRGNNPLRALRAVVGLGAGIPITWLGVAQGMLRRDKRAGINFVFERWIDFMLQASDVKLRIVGEDNAWKHRPAIFLVNHRTTFDGIVAMRIVRKDFTAVAKAEIGKNPLGSAIGQLLDIAWVERENKEAAVAALQPLEELTRSGLSVLIAPEGTRTEDDEIGPFKKGAFRMSMATGLPIVPIVVRNAEVIGGRSALAMHPGTVDVAVLEPIRTDDWTLDDLDDRIEAVRQLYVDTLAEWPEGAS